MHMCRQSLILDILSTSSRGWKKTQTPYDHGGSRFGAPAARARALAARATLDADCGHVRSLLHVGAARGASRARLLAVARRRLRALELLARAAARAEIGAACVGKVDKRAGGVWLVPSRPKARPRNRPAARRALRPRSGCSALRGALRGARRAGARRAAHAQSAFFLASAVAVAACAASSCRSSCERLSSAPAPAPSSASWRLSAATSARPSATPAPSPAREGACEGGGEWLE